MNYIKKISFPLLIMISIILISPIIISVLSYIGLNNKLTSILKILVSLITFLVGGILIGKRSNKKGYLEGIKLSIIFIVLATIFILFMLDTPLKIKNMLYYIILTITCMFGSIISIQKKTN